MTNFVRYFLKFEEEKTKIWNGNFCIFWLTVFVGNAKFVTFSDKNPIFWETIIVCSKFFQQWVISLQFCDKSLIDVWDGKIFPSFYRSNSVFWLQRGKSEFPHQTSIKDVSQNLSSSETFSMLRLIWGHCKKKFPHMYALSSNHWR